VEFQEYIERLKDSFISDNHTDEIKKAKQEFIAIGGELGNEVDSYEDILDIFFDWYIFDRPRIAERVTPLSRYIQVLSRIFIPYLL